MWTNSGRLVRVTDLRSEDICIEDIAHSLAHQCRFAGHVREHYSVAQHSVLVSEFCAPADALWGLLHDASEAYVVDLPTPVKRLAGIRELYGDLETQVQHAVCAAFGLAADEPESVLAADYNLVHAEMLDLMPALPVSARAKYARCIIGASLPEEIKPWPVVYAKEQFLCRFEALKGAIGR